MNIDLKWEQDLDLDLELDNIFSMDFLRVVGNKLYIRFSQCWKEEGYISVLDPDDEDPYLKGVESQESSEHYEYGCAGPDIGAS